MTSKHPSRFRPATALFCFAALLLAGQHASAQKKSDFLTSRPLLEAKKVKTIKVGSAIETASGQRRRLSLPGGSVLYVNENTMAKLESPGELALARGEVFVELSPAKKEFIVATGPRRIRASKSSFAVRTGSKGTGVLVTRGKVQVGDLKKPLLVGQRVLPGGRETQAAPRLSHLLHWTRDLMVAAENSLVPDSKFAGGALIAADPNGQETKLTLRKYHIDVYIEDGFARTTIDQSYFNHENFQMEGKFYFPLPPDASLSRLAMYVDGNLMEGGMVVREYGAEVYETIRYAQRDPALLEWVDGSTFKMRVFPIESRKEKRILLSYTQRLPSLYGRLSYRFPAGHSLPAVRDWSVAFRVKGAAPMAWDNPSHDLKMSKEKGDLLLSAKQKNALFKKDVVLSIDDPNAEAHKARFATAVHEGNRYLLVRLRPDLLRVEDANPQAGEDPGPQNWLFLFETSGDRDPLMARVQIEIIRNLLHHAGPQDTFNIMTANTRMRFWHKDAQPVSPENAASAIAWLEGSHLIGALDLDQAFEAAAARLRLSARNILVHSGTAIAAMGERRLDILSKRFGKQTRYIGVGVGKRWNRSLMKAAAERTGGYFTQINPDESVTWRSFELFSTIAALGPAHLRKVEVANLLPLTDEKNPPRFLHFNQLLTEGEELAAVVRLNENEPLPKGVRLRFADEKTLDVPIKSITKNADYLPRTWAKLEIDRLLNENPVKNKAAIIELSKAMYVMTPFTSLLVLENDDMYTQYKVDRGRKDHWALYPAPRKIKVVYEPDPNAGKIKGRKKAKDVIESIFVRGQPRLINWPDPARRARLINELLKRNPAANPRIVVGELEKVLEAMNMNIDSADERLIAESLELLSSSSSLGVARISGSPLSFIPPPPPHVGQIVLDEAIYLKRPMIITTPIRIGQDFPYITGTTTTGARLPQLGGVLLRASERRSFDEFHRAIREQRVVQASTKIGRDARLAIYPVGELLMPLDQHSRFLDVDGRFAGLRAFKNGASKGANKFSHDDIFNFYIGISNGTSNRKNAFRELLNSHSNVAQNLLNPGESASILYRRPGYTGDMAIFSNLLAYAPGMNSSLADALAVIDAEAIQYRKPKFGMIDDGARQLIVKARAMGWRKLDVTDKKGKTIFTIYFDGQGRFAYERTLPPGIREQVVCDSETMVHIYPQLGMAARRSVSRFHRADAASMLPWLILPAGDLNRSADVKLIGKNTVAIIPHVVWPKDTKEKDKITYQIRLIFGKNGRLAERQLVKMPKEEVVLRQVLSADGTVRLIDRKGKEHVALRGKVSPADLKNDTSPIHRSPQRKQGVLSPSPLLALRAREFSIEAGEKQLAKLGYEGLVVLDLPFRSPQHLIEKYKLQKTAVQNYPFAYARQIMAAQMAAGQSAEAQQTFTQALRPRGQRQLGLYVILAACGRNLDAQNLNVLDEHPESPLAQYLALHTSDVLRKHAAQWALGSVQWKEPFLKHLATTHALYQRWQSKQTDKWSPARMKLERQKAFAYVRANKDSGFGWVLLCLLQDRAGKDTKFHKELAEHFKRFAEVPALRYTARCEQARSLYRAGLYADAREQFEKLYAESMDKGVLPAVDGDFRRALLQDKKDPDAWSDLLRRTAATLIKKKNRGAVLTLAWQCWQLSDAPMANQMVAAALKDIEDKKERAAVRLACVQFYRQTSQLPEADRLLKTLLDDPEYGKYPVLWRIAGAIAAGRSQTSTGVRHLEWALNLEYKNLPAVINLEKIRSDYGKVLARYETLADAMVTLKIKPSPLFFSKVIRAADRWRSVDSDDTQACQITARILRTLGDQDLAWDYMTTPLAMQPNESGPWVNLAESLRLLGKLDLADRAYKAASEAEPTNAQIVWDRAHNLQQGGKTAQARELYRHIAEGNWQPRFQGLASQARQRLR